jgi:hypothetical protein
MEEAPENGKESSHSAHANGMNEYVALVNQHDEPYFIATCGLSGSIIFLHITS